jgi:hypothetical protein
MRAQDCTGSEGVIPGNLSERFLANHGNISGSQPNGNDRAEAVRRFWHNFQLDNTLRSNSACSSSYND